MNNSDAPNPVKSPDSLLVWLAVGLGTGLSPIAPGTVGSLLGLPLVWGLASASIEGWWLLIPSIILFWTGIPICNAGARHYHREDPGAVVFDEIAAFPIIYLLTSITMTTAIIGFIFFRFFDILKPWPIRRFEKLEGGLGVMIDDTLAAVLAMLCLWGVELTILS